jgi:hypothetical protein
MVITVRVRFLCVFILFSSFESQLFCQDELVSIQTSDTGTAYIGCDDEEARIIEVKKEADREYTTFRLVEGLANRDDMSFESAVEPSFYLRHQNGRIKLHEFQDRGLFKRDATFKKTGGLLDPLDPALVSFESFNFPNYFLVRKEEKLYIEPFADSGSYKRDATFRITPPNWNGTNPVVRSINTPKMHINAKWIRNFLLFILFGSLIIAGSVASTILRSSKKPTQKRKNARPRRPRSPSHT